jgi:hypothetical protein
MEAVRTSETSVDNNFTRQYIPEDNSEHHTRRRENLKSHICLFIHKLSTFSELRKRYFFYTKVRVHILETLCMSS